MKTEIKKILYKFLQDGISSDDATQQVLDLFSVKYQKELLLSMFDLAKTMPDNLTKADKLKVVNKFIDNNCG